MFTPTNF